MARAWTSPALLLTVLALTGTAAAQTVPPTTVPAPAPRIAPNVSAGGQAVGGLTVAEATARLEATLGRRLRADIGVLASGRRFRLRTTALRFRFDAARTARRALKAGARAPGEAHFGEPVDVPVAVEFSRRRLRAFVARVARSVYVAPRNATLRITLRHMFRRRSYGGRRLRERPLRAAIARVLRDPGSRRVLKGRRDRVRAPVTYRALARLNRTIITIDRRGFRLRLFKRLRYDRSYPIAVGAAGFDTPSGLFRIREKQVNPPWHAPNRPWAGSYAGRTVPGGAPDNPLKARWLGVASGVGIHGTAEPWSIGSAASHGCIRMRVPDVIDLYPRVPVGAQVLIR